MSYKLERKPSMRSKLLALEVDDVVPPFLAKKLELCRKLGESPAESPSGPSQRKMSDSPKRGVQSPDAHTDPELENLRKKDAFLRSIFMDNKLNHRQKEHIAANILIGKQEAETRAPVFSQVVAPISPSRVGNIVTEGHRQRHVLNHRSVELVGGSVEIKQASAKEMRLTEVSRAQGKSVKPGVYTWANEVIPAVPPYKLQSHRSFEGVKPSRNREFIVDQISLHNSVKAKKNADQVRILKMTALQEKSTLGKDVVQEVSVKKKLKIFRKKLKAYLEKKNEPQRGEIMRCIDEETIYTFMENFKGYSMSPDVILSLLGTSLGSAASEGVLLVPDQGALSGENRSGYLPVQSSHQELSVHLRGLHVDSLQLEESAHDHSCAIGFAPHTIPNPSNSARPAPPKSTGTTVNGFKVIPRPSSTMGSGFVVSKAPSTAQPIRIPSAKLGELSVAGAATGSPGRGLARSSSVAPLSPERVSSSPDAIKISAGADKSTWVTEFEPSITAPPASPPPMDSSFRDSTVELEEAVPLSENLAEPMRTHMAATNTLPSLFPEKVLTDEELLALGNKTMTFEEIALKKEREKIAAKRAKKPVTGLAGLKGSKAIHMQPVVPKTPIPRFIRTPGSGGEDFFPKSPNPAYAPVNHFSDDIT